jgi:DNA repair protein RecO (recombination protein O)
LPSKVSEAFTLRTYPYREADLIVSFFTRDQGRLRGVARAAKRPKNSFGSGLERLTQVRMFYHQKENVELVRLTSCDIVQSQFHLTSDYSCGVALDYFAELCEQLLPPAEPNEKFYRLLGSVLDALRSGTEAERAGRLWMALSYFSLWAVRLSGFLPDLRRSEYRLSPESQEMAKEMLITPIRDLTPREWTRAATADLRRALAREIEHHIERRLVTAPLLETL